MTDDRLVAPSLKVDLGFSLSDLNPSSSIEIPLPTPRRRRDRFALPLQRWRIRWRAYRDAKKHLPDYERNEPSATEAEIVRLREMKTEAVDRTARAAILDASEAIDQLTPTELHSNESLASVGNSFFSWLTSYQELLAQALHVITRNQRECGLAKARLDTFREEVGDHRLIASSVRPQAPEPFSKRMGILLFAGIFESLLAMVLFGETSQYGLVGAWWNAATISALNIGHGLLTGYLLMRLLTVEKGKLVFPLGVALTVVNGSSALWANLFVSHFRSGSELSWSKIFPPDAMSAVLLLIGLTIWLFAAYKGWNDFSPDFKDHADLWAEYQAAERSYEGARAWFLGTIGDMRETTLSKLDSVRSTVTDLRNRHMERLVAIRDLCRRAEASLQHAHLVRKNITATADMLLREYRETNFTCRNDLNGPEIKVEYVPNDRNEMEIEAQPLLDQAQQAEELIKKNLDSFSRFRQGFESRVAEKVSERLKVIETNARKSFEGQDDDE